MCAERPGAQHPTPAGATETAEPGLQEEGDAVEVGVPAHPKGVRWGLMITECDTPGLCATCRTATPSWSHPIALPLSRSLSLRRGGILLHCVFSQALLLIKTFG